MLRYVILRHELPLETDRPSHWDLMLQQGDALRTWALDALPRPGEPVDAQPLPDHRLAYLDYEGPISGGRGRVHRWDAGAYRLVSESPEHLRLMLFGEQLQGQLLLRLVAKSPPQWRVELSDAPRS